MDPLVSIIVPVYNVKPYLNRCVDSLLGQSYQNMELLLVDDGSTDGSETLCDEYAAQDARVRVLHKKNGGLSDARNAGVDAAKGEYLSFVDGDDWVSPYYIENLYRALEQAGADFRQGRRSSPWPPRRLPRRAPPRAGRRVRGRSAVQRKTGRDCGFRRPAPRGGTSGRCSPAPT